MTPVRAVIARAPAAGRVDVVDVNDADQAYEKCPYMPRGTDDPATGDTCLVAFDHLGAPWVVAWFPAD